MQALQAQRLSRCRRIASPGKIAAQASKLCEVEGERSGLTSSVTGIADELVEQGGFRFSQCACRRRVRRDAIEHGEPENSPAQIAEDRHQIGEALGGAQFRVFCSAARLQDFVEHFDLPRIAYQLIFSIATARPRTGRSIISFHSIGFRPFGAPRSLAWITASSREG